MKPIVLQGIGETLEGLSTLIQSQIRTARMPENERKPMMKACDYVLKARTMISVALAAHLDNELY